MKLWLLRPTEVGEDGLSWDCSKGFVVRAKSSVGARKLIGARREKARVGIPYPRARLDHPFFYVGEEDKGFWSDPTRSSCEELRLEGKEEIVVQDYKAG